MASLNKDRNSIRLRRGSLTPTTATSSSSDLVSTRDESAGPVMLANTRRRASLMPGEGPQVFNTSFNDNNSTNSSSKRRGSLNSFPSAPQLLEGLNSSAGSGNGGGGSQLPPSSDTIRVICRFRPGRNNNVSNDQGNYLLDEHVGVVKCISDLYETRAFTFDKVFGYDTNQRQIFQEVEDVIGGTLSGFNGTIMAYGQTSAGKSHTMEGSSLHDQDVQGILPRCIHRLFDAIHEADVSIQFQIVLSYYEIYCEKIRDLLNPQQTNLKIRENKGAGFLLPDLTEISVMNREDCFRIIEIGKTNRATSPTLMNAESSRSHSIFSIRIEQKHGETGRCKRGKLFLVDLAGSEKVSKTGASGMRLEEAKNINSSLTTLGMVINALADGAKHIPYRDSKLTMLLSEALGGNSKTTLIICCNPEITHAPETLSTLRFGERAKKIKTHAKVNEELSIEELKNLLEAAKKEIHILKKKIKQGMSSDDLDDYGDVERLRSLSPFISRSSSPLPNATIMSNAENSMTSSSAFDASREMDKLRQQYEAALEETEALRARVRALEEEVETERMRSAEEHVQALQKVSEAEALRVTIQDLEARLLKNTMTAKSRSSTYVEGMEGLTIPPPPDKPPRRPSASGANANRPLPPSPPHASPKATSTTSSIKRLLGREKTNSQDSEKRPIAYENGGEDNGNDDDNASLLDVDLQVVEEQSHTLTLRLEQDIRGLSRAVSMHEVATRSAQAEAQNYAEKYVKLREEYETYVQRLMVKLTHEQQTRAMLEEKLEDVYARLANGAAASSSFTLGSGSGGNSSGFGGDKESHRQSTGGYFAGWFGRGHESSRASFSAKSRNSFRLSDREQSILRSLELAQSRVGQLQSELDTNREAHAIVLETKESVMRSLARQNSQLIVERDNLSRRNEELVTSIDQLTALLRSLQNRSKDHLGIPSQGQGPTARIASYIHGGSQHRLPASNALSEKVVAEHASSR
eukprot:gene8382-9240_t